MDVTLAVDALAPNPGGIGRYTWELCEGLAGRDELSSLRFFARNRLIDDPGRLLRGEPIYRGRRPRRWIRAWKARRALRSTLVHGPNFFLPEAAPTGVITVHDLSVFRYPETHPAERVRAFEKLFASSLERAAHIITDTETVRREIIESYSVRPGMITAVHLGVDRRFKPLVDGDTQRIFQQWGLTAGGYGLCVSTLEPRKKIAELIRAWRRLPSPLRKGFPLVLAGGTGWRNDELHEEIRRAKAEGWVRHLGFVDEALLPQLYAGAALFIYPSIYEGFGLPPLEAMASGVPVVTSNRSCLPEVSGDAARYVDPDDEVGLTSAIEQALSDPEWRSEAVRRGLIRARGFSWSRCIDGTVAAYRQAASRS